MKLARVIATIISLTGVAIVVGVERSLRRSLHLLEYELVVEQMFTMIVLAAAALGAFFIVYGLASASPNSASRIKVFLFAEAPIALVSGGFAALWLNRFHLVGDVGPRNPVEVARIPFPLLVFFRPALFYTLLVALVVVAFVIYRLKNRAAA